MKRGGPLRRRKPLQAKTPLKRGGELARKTRLRSRPKAATPERVREAQARWIAAVLRKAPRDKHGRRCCAVTGRPQSALDPLEGHHVIDQQKLKRVAKTLGVAEEELLWDERVGLPVLRSRHARHTSRAEPIPRAALRPENWEFAEAVGLREWVEARYP